MNRLVIDCSRQKHYLMDSHHVAKTYDVSTAVNGLGEIEGSGCTPRGLHAIRAKIGQGMHVNTIFVNRRPTGELFSEALLKHSPHRDFILSRILWLSGLEKGVNRLGCVDTMRRYIYIHGSPESFFDGTPRSKGCIRMKSSQLIELFNSVNVGCTVTIK